ncbi:MAG: sporangiospore maturation cell wall hydrolase GsmA [Hamadaea sp.]|nr:sporangiospore maturation cell wall hydrolase GsmA [Hamadaea sp.]
MRWTSFAVLVLPLTLMTGLVPAPALAAPAPAAVAAAASQGHASVRSAVGLNVRSGPGLTHKVLPRLAHRAAVTISCRVRGQQIVGSQRTTTRWNRLSTGGYVSDAFLAWSTSRSQTPSCAAPAVVAGGTPIATVNLKWPLNVRSGPGTTHKIVGELAAGARVPVGCRAWAQKISGDPVWYWIGPRRWVTQAFVRWTPSQPPLPWCGQAAPLLPAASNAAFLSRVAGPAQTSARAWGVPASVTIAQAILESGWGRSRLTSHDHNYFGMKCFGDPGPLALGCSTYATRECDGDRCFGIRDTFRAYRNPTDSFADHGRALARLSIYKTAMKHAGAPERFAVELQRAGYATSPTYAKKLIGIMRDFNLYKYDVRRA